jgi:hypothetical protein
MMYQDGRAVHAEDAIDGITFCDKNCLQLTSLLRGDGARRPEEDHQSRVESPSEHVCLQE